MLKTPTKFIIYEILNLKNGKYYIGRTKGKNGTIGRWSVHVAHAKYGERYNKTYFEKNGKSKQTGNCYFSRAIRKYGQENFRVRVIDYAIDFKHMVWLEGFYIKYYNSNNQKYGYNLIIDRYGDGLEFISEETSNKLTNSLHQTKRKPSKSGWRGVHYGNTDGKHNTNPWSVSVTFKRKLFRKRVETLEIAIDISDKIALFLYGDNARLNFPEKISEYKNSDLQKTFDWFIYTRPVSSDFLGVFYNKNDKKFSSRVKEIGKGETRLYLGEYDLEIDAAIIHDKICWYLYKDSFVLNFPENIERYEEEDLEKLYNYYKNSIKQFNRETSSNFRGVSKHGQRENGYCWEVRHNGSRNRGFSTSEIEAAQSYDKKAVELLGLKAKTNFPIENYLTIETN
jgi:hypothetical protein